MSAADVVELTAIDRRAAAVRSRLSVCLSVSGREMGKASGPQIGSMDPPTDERGGLGVTTCRRPSFLPSFLSSSALTPYTHRFVLRRCRLIRSSSSGASISERTRRVNDVVDDCAYY